MGTAPTRARGGAVLLAVGIVALEFAAAVSRFVASTLLPAVVRDLDARDRLGLLVAGSTLGLFVALPLADRVARRLGHRGTLTAGLLAYLAGTAVTATSRAAWVFAVGQFAGGFASGLLAVFGVSAAIRHLDEALRVRVVAASSAMWIVPALVGPPATLALEHAFGWRWTLLVPLPVVVVGRLMIVRATGSEAGLEAGCEAGWEAGAETRPQLRPLWRTLLVPVGVAALLVCGNRSLWPVAAAGTVAALVGVWTVLPAGVVRLRRGTPAALGAMLLFATGYFGADGLVTVLLTDGYGTSAARAGLVLSAAPLAWGLTSLLLPRLPRPPGQGRPPPAAGLALAAAGVAVLTAGLSTSAGFGVALAAWGATGAGVGLAYPGLYIGCTTVADGGPDATALATAVITAEAFGSLLGGAAGGAAVSIGAAAGLPGGGGLAVAYCMFAACVAAGALAATRLDRSRREVASAVSVADGGR